MRAAKSPLSPRVVLDTNVLISELLFRNGRLAALRTAWLAGHCVPVASRATIDELRSILEYRKFKLTSEQQAAALAMFVPYIEPHQVHAQAVAKANLPLCRDPKDQIFLDLAQSANAGFLVSGDEDLLVLDGALKKQSSFRIVQPQALLTMLARG